jgi:hypothetical protein
MEFAIESDYMDVRVSGDFHLLKMYQSILRQIMRNHPEHNEIARLKDNFGDLPEQDFTFAITFKDASPLFEFLGVDMRTKEQISVTGQFDQSTNDFSLSARADSLSAAGIHGRDIAIELNSTSKKGNLGIKVGRVDRGINTLDNIEFNTDIDGNQLSWTASYFRNEFNHMFVDAVSEAKGGGYFTKLNSHDIQVDSVAWSILPNRGLGIYRDSIDIEQFVMTDGYRSVGLKDIDKRGLESSLDNFNFEFINPIINYDKLYFTGYADSKFRVEDIFDNRSIQGFLEVADFQINGDPYGSLLLRAKQAESSVIDLDLGIEMDTRKLYARGYLNTAQEYTNLDISIEEYPMNFFEYIIDDGISETQGTTNIDAKIYGKLNDLKLSGLATVYNAGVKIDYLGAFYTIDNQQIPITESYIDLSQLILTDELENQAYMSGGLRHNFLGDFRTDLRITSDQFIALNTTNLDNPLYYGLGHGAIEVDFTGPFDAVNMRVNATTGPFTQLYIPITSTQYGYDESFIKFDYEKAVQDTVAESIVKLLQGSGVDFEMSLTFTPDAEVQVIYDETTSNVLIGRGRGNLRINVKRDGEFTVFGNYDVEDGEYLYTAYGFIAKPFEIRRGGTVTWTGDPINASLNVSADYPGLRAPLNVFLQEYIESSSLQYADFTQRREVDLTLLLSGTLFDPTINFDIDFPILTGELKTLADSKVRTLKATENGINNQVVGLLVFRNFLPDNNPFASLSGETIGQSGNNTLTEFLTSQLSLLFSDYLSSKLADNEFITGIDFEIAVAQNTSVLGETEQDFLAGFVDFVPDEVQFNLRNRFLNDNFILNIGGNYIRQNSIGTAEDYLTGDFAIEWFITEDKRLKLRFYGNYDYDEAFAQRKQIYGFGVNYRREFGKISDFETIINGIVDEINRTSEPSTSLE